MARCTARVIIFLAWQGGGGFKITRVQGPLFMVLASDCLLKLCHVTLLSQLTFEAASVLLQRSQNLANYIFIVKEIIHLIVERGSTISDNISVTIFTSLGHMEIILFKRGVKLSICFITIIRSNHIFLEDKAPLAYLPVRFFLSV